MKKRIVGLLLLFTCGLSGLDLGIDRLVQEEEWLSLLQGKRVGLLTHLAAVNQKGESSITQLLRSAKKGSFTLTALFAPEHGIDGTFRAFDAVPDSKDPHGLPIYSLHGVTRRPTKEMLQTVDLVVVDLQDIGCRSYTYLSTLCYLMEECAKAKKMVIVADRPNPMGGVIVDGPLLEKSQRYFLGYLPIPYVHGMTLGELALYFNAEEKVGCLLKVIPMRGWKRQMTWDKTGLPWVPTSPHIPDADTPFFYATTGLFGDLSLVSIGIGYNLPFKVVGAPWIDAPAFKEALNAQQFPGVRFVEMHYIPFFGAFKEKVCHGVKIIVTDPLKFYPVETCFLLLGTLKSLYPEEYTKALLRAKAQQSLTKLSGTKQVVEILQKEKFVVFPLKTLCQEARSSFTPLRAKYLLKEYL